MATLEEVARGRSAHEVLAWSRQAIEPDMRAAVDTLPRSMRLVAGYHFGWWDQHGRPTGADGGKAIRPALVLLAAEAAGGAAATAAPAAVAVELVHNFSLLHDDVMDGDITRRHRPTAWSVFGESLAILAGDALLALAFQVLSASGHSSAREGMAMLSAAVEHLVDGQGLDMTFEQRGDVRLGECLNMAAGKAGALLGCSCGIGALFGDAGPEQVAHLRSFGEQLGLAFQLVDDLLGIWGDPAVTGKPVYSDLRNRKKSLPVVAALSSGTPAGRELAALYRRDRPLSGAELVHAAELIDLAGGHAWSQAQVDDLLAQALGHLGSAAPPARAAEELGALARLATRRDH
jgi:geranylgeranyl diphosphate synthase type I